MSSKKGIIKVNPFEQPLKLTKKFYQNQKWKLSQVIIPKNTDFHQGDLYKNPEVEQANLGYNSPKMTNFETKF